MDLSEMESRLNFIYSMIQITSSLQIKSQCDYWTSEYIELYSKYETELLKDKKEENKNGINKNENPNSMDWI